MLGQIEIVLNNRYGSPTSSRTSLDTIWTWNESGGDAKSVLYEPLQHRPPTDRSYVLDNLYGNMRGGFLVGDSLRVSLRSGPSLFGLATIQELHRYPEVLRALELAPDALYFMDAANVWFYGVRQDHLVVYDSDSDESYELGTFQSALPQLLDEWENDGISE